MAAKTGKKAASGAKKSAQKKTARKYGPKASAAVAEELHEFKEGTLRSGSGKLVTSREQAIAIGLSEARREGDKVPPAPKKTRKKS